MGPLDRSGSAGGRGGRCPPSDIEVGDVALLVEQLPGIWVADPTGGSDLRHLHLTLLLGSLHTSRGGRRCRGLGLPARPHRAVSAGSPCAAGRPDRRGLPILSPAPSSVCRSLPCMPAACSQDGPYNRSAEAHTGHLGLGFRSGVVGGCPGWSAAPPRAAAEDLAVGLTCGVTDTESADDCGRGVSEGLVAAWSPFGPEGNSGGVVGVEVVSVLVLGSWSILQLPCKAAGWPGPKGAPLSVGGAGEPIARGRDAEVYALGDGRVLRRYRAPGPTGREMRVMAWARSHGYPVPQVYERTVESRIVV